MIMLCANGEQIVSTRPSISTRCSAAKHSAKSPKVMLCAIIGKYSMPTPPLVST